MKGIIQHNAAIGTAHSPINVYGLCWQLKREGRDANENAHNILRTLQKEPGTADDPLAIDHHLIDKSQTEPNWVYVDFYQMLSYNEAKKKIKRADGYRIGVDEEASKKGFDKQRMEAGDGVGYALLTHDWRCVGLVRTKSGVELQTFNVASKKGSAGKDDEVVTKLHGRFHYISTVDTHERERRLGVARLLLAATVASIRASAHASDMGVYLLATPEKPNQPALVGMDKGVPKAVLDSLYAEFKTDVARDSYRYMLF